MGRRETFELKRLREECPIRQGFYIADREVWNSQPFQPKGAPYETLWDAPESLIWSFVGEPDDVIRSKGLARVVWLDDDGRECAPR